MKSIQLKGITWNHTRGYVPMIATAQRFEQRHPNVAIHWEKRSLQAFANEDISQLAENYDMIVMDHPWTGYAARSGILTSIDKYLPQTYLVEQEKNSVGKSFQSYCSEGKLWALPIDAAAPVASFRRDLFEKYTLNIPRTWNDLEEIANRGLAIMPGISVDILMNFYMLCISEGQKPFINKTTFIPEEIGIKALKRFKSLSDKMDQRIFNWNPINIYEILSTENDFIYCPFAYGYSVYTSDDYNSYPLEFTDIVVSSYGKVMRSTLGGTGLAISASCSYQEIAMEYAAYVAAPITQKSIYFDSGGQPGHRLAWMDNNINRHSSNYFKNTLNTLDQAYLRPNYDGYLFFQDHAGEKVRQYLIEGGSEQNLLNTLNDLLKESHQRSK